MDMSDLTLVFFVRARQFNIQKLVDHYSSLSCRKVIYDSSDDHISEDDISKLKSKNFEYVWLGAVNFLIAKNLAFSNVKTKFVMDCTDDDLFLLSSIKNSLVFLRDNPDYVSCQGREYWYNSANKVLSRETDINGYKKILDEDPHSENWIERIKINFSPFTGIAHSMHNTKFHLENNRFLLENLNYRSGVWEELIPGILSALQGNRKIISDIWVVRHRLDQFNGSRYRLDRISQYVNDFYNGVKEAVTDDVNLKPICEYISNIKDYDFNLCFDLIKSSIDGMSSFSKNAAGKSAEIDPNEEIVDIINIMNSIDITNLEKE